MKSSRNSRVNVQNRVNESFGHISADFRSVSKEEMKENREYSETGEYSKKARHEKARNSETTPFPSLYELVRDPDPARRSVLKARILFRAFSSPCTNSELSSLSNGLENGEMAR